MDLNGKQNTESEDISDDDEEGNAETWYKTPMLKKISGIPKKASPTSSFGHCCPYPGCLTRLNPKSRDKIKLHFRYHADCNIDDAILTDIFRIAGYVSIEHFGELKCFAASCKKKPFEGLKQHYFKEHLSSDPSVNSNLLYSILLSTWSLQANLAESKDDFMAAAGDCPEDEIVISAITVVDNPKLVFAQVPRDVQKLSWDGVEPREKPGWHKISTMNTPRGTALLQLEALEKTKSPNATFQGEPSSTRLGNVVTCRAYTYNRTAEQRKRTAHAFYQESLQRSLQQRNNSPSWEQGEPPTSRIRVETASNGVYKASTSGSLPRKTPQQKPTTNEQPRTSSQVNPKVIYNPHQRKPFAFTTLNTAKVREIVAIKQKDEQIVASGRLEAGKPKPKVLIEEGLKGGNEDLEQYIANGTFVHGDLELDAFQFKGVEQENMIEAMAYICAEKERLSMYHEGWFPQTSQRPVGAENRSYANPAIFILSSMRNSSGHCLVCKCVLEKEIDVHEHAQGRCGSSVLILAGVVGALPIAFQPEVVTPSCEIDREDIRTGAAAPATALGGRFHCIAVGCARTMLDYVGYKEHILVHHPEKLIVPMNPDVPCAIFDSEKVNKMTEEVYIKEMNKTPKNTAFGNQNCNEDSLSDSD